MRGQDARLQKAGTLRRIRVGSEGSSQASPHRIEHRTFGQRVGAVNSVSRRLLSQYPYDAKLAVSWTMVCRACVVLSSSSNSVSPSHCRTKLTARALRGPEQHSSARRPSTSPAARHRQQPAGDVRRRPKGCRRVACHFVWRELYRCAAGSQRLYGRENVGTEAWLR
jgi:hypothetical protein